MIGAEIERQREFAQDRADAVGDLRRDMGEQHLVLRHLAGKAGASAAQQSAVEELAILAHALRASSAMPARGSIMTSMAIGGEEITLGLELRNRKPLRLRQRCAARSTTLADLCCRRSASPAASASAPWASVRRLLDKDRFIAPPLCERLGVPLPYETGSPSLSAAAIADPPVYDRARAAARYSSTMRELIQSFKYGDRHEGVPLFGRWMATAGAELLADADVILPVPLYRSRFWSRASTSRPCWPRGRPSDGVPVDCFLLARVKRTHAQVGSLRRSGGRTSPEPSG